MTGGSGTSEPVSNNADQLEFRIQQLQAENAELRAALHAKTLGDGAFKTDFRAYFQTLLEAAPYGIGLHDGERIFISNRRLAAMFGYEVSEIIGHNPIEFASPEARQVLEAKIVACTEEVYESVGIRKDGSRFPVEIAARQTDFSNAPLRILIIRDLTEQKQIEIGHGLALRSARMGTWTRNLHTSAVTWSPELEDIFGLQPGSFPGTEEAFFAFVYPDDRNHVAATIAEALKTGDEYHFDFRFITASGELRWMEARGKAFRDAHGQPETLVGVGIDITERKFAEDELIRKSRELSRSNSDLKEFAYVASHDLQEPLRMICNYGQLLQSRYKGELGSDADEFINYMVSGSQRMSQLVHDVLAYSTISSGDRQEFRPVDLNTVISTAVSNLKASIEANGASVEHRRLPTIDGDDIELVELFENLISNSVKYRSADPPQVRIEASKNGREWIVNVSDNGLGIDPRYHDRIFGLFKRLHGHRYPGTGLGLAICRRVMEKHRGRIWVESRVGQGATFCCAFPFLRDAGSE